MLTEVRWATRDDEPLLRELCRSVPMKGPISYYLEREPDYFALTSLQGREPRIAVIADPDAPSARLAGMAATVSREVLLGGVRRTLGYACDARIRPDGRRSGRFATLMRAIAEDISARGVDHAYGIVLGGNPLMDGVMRHTRSARYHKVSRIRNHSIFPPLRVRRRSDVRPARTGDLPVLADLWRRAHADRDCVPALDAGRLTALLGAGVPGLSIDKVRVVERDGRIAGFALPWDTTPLKQVRLLGLSRGLRAFRTIYGPLARLLGRATVPADGALLPFHYLALPCAIDAAALRALIDDGLAHLDKSLYLDLALDTRDPLNAALKGLLSTHVDFDLVEVTPPGVAPILDPSHLTFFDMAFV